jgi:hypothetical protein
MNDFKMEEKQQIREASRRTRLANRQEAAWTDTVGTLDKITSHDLSAEMAELQENIANKEARDLESQNVALNDAEFAKFDPSFRRLSDFIGLDPADRGRMLDELNVVMGWAKNEAKSNNILDVLQEVKSLKKKLGFKEVGPTSLKKLYQYIRLDLDSRRIRQEKELMKE